MRSYNRILIIGNLGGDPEVRMTPGGTKVANLRVATNERWTDRNGQAQEHTEWFTVVLYGRVAEVAEKYLRKGSRVFIEGSLRTRKWQDREGKDRYTTEVRAFNMVMLDARVPDLPEEGTVAPPPDESVPPPEEEDDIPF